MKQEARELIPCGRYPIRDPFFKMLPRSLNNFMNAFTTTDHTMYPISTTNKTDFRNLMTMYLDATLHPLLKESDFRQEGWRVGPEDPHAAPGQPGGNLVFKGVVYNEMKGQFSDTTYLYYMRWLQRVFPSLNFYGGDPQAITNLKWQDLTKFHADHYHPSNSKIITYGDTPFQEHLSILGSELDRFTKSSADTAIKMPATMDKESEDVTISGPVDAMLPEDAQNKISVTWLMGETKNIQEAFALRIATTLLLDGYGSPMYRALVESGLGTDYSANTGLDTSSAQGIFAVGLNGVSDANLEAVKSAIHNTVSTVVKQGFDDQKVQGLLHQLELGLKHKSAAFGLDLINRLTPGWFNGIRPLDALSWNVVVDEFKQRYQEKGYLESLLAKYLTTDRHMTFVMRPENGFAADLAADEEKRLQAKISQGTSEFGKEGADKHFRDQELDLLQEQESGREQSLDCLPTLSVADIPRTQPVIVTSQSTVPPDVKVQWREANTNGLTYFRAITTLNLNDELRSLVPLFCDCLIRLGTKSKSVEEIEDLIKLKTGGISFAYHSSPSPRNASHAEEGLLLTSYALDQNVSAMYDLLFILLTETDFTSSTAKTNIRQLLQASASGAVDAVAESGHGYAIRYAGASLSPYGKMIEQTSGLTQVEAVSRLAQIDENSAEMDHLITQLRQLQNIVASQFSKQSRVAITCTSGSMSDNRERLTKFVDAVGAGIPKQTAASDLLGPLRKLQSGKIFFDLPYQVYYSGLSLSAFPYVDARSAPLAVLAQLLTHKHLHHEIREKGGAYGAGAYSRGLSGAFGMFSYRDPSPENTFKVMRQAGLWARDRSWAPNDLEEAKLSMFQAIDAPQSVSDEGMVSFMSGVDPQMEQQRRELLLDVNKDQVRTAAEWLMEQIEAQKENLVVLGEKKAWAESDWKVEDLGRL